MWRTVMLNLGSTAFELRLPTRTSRESIAWAVDALVRGAFYLLVPLLVSGNLIFQSSNMNVALVMFYVLGALALLSLSVRLLLLGGHKFQDVPNLMATILFAILNMSIILLPNHRPVLLEPIQSFNSGMTLMAAVIVFYYLAASGAAFARRMLQLVIAGVGVLALLLLLSVSSSSAYYVWLFVMLPLVTTYLLQTRQLISKIGYGLVAVLIVINFLVYWANTNSLWELLVAGLAAMLTSITLMLMRRDTYRKLRQDLGQLVRRRKLPGRFWQQYPVVQLLLISLTLVILSIIGMWRVGQNIAAPIDFVIRSYQGAVTSIGTNIGSLLSGGTTLLNSNATFISQALRAAGLIGLVSLVVIFVLGFKRLAVSNTDYLGIARYIWIALPLVALLIDFPIILFAIWWIMWSAGATSSIKAKK